MAATAIGVHMGIVTPSRKGSVLDASKCTRYSDIASFNLPFRKGDLLPSAEKKEMCRHRRTRDSFFPVVANSPSLSNPQVPSVKAAHSIRSFGNDRLRRGRICERTAVVMGSRSRLSVVDLPFHLFIPFQHLHM